MAEELHISQGSKEEKYALLYRQICALVEGECDDIANMANVAAMIHITFGFWWTGFYRVIGDELVLGPFQGPLACSRIAFGRGVCGTAWKEGVTQVVPDVEKFPGHIACSSESKSEIVVPVKAGGKITAVLDIDSEKLNTFDDTDRVWLEKIIKTLQKRASSFLQCLISQYMHSHTRSNGNEKNSHPPCRCHKESTIEKSYPQKAYRHNLHP